MHKWKNYFYWCDCYWNIKICYPTFCIHGSFDLSSNRCGFILNYFR